MDNHTVVGVGNIYANESLFKAGIHPQLAAGKISLARYKKLVDFIKETLQKAIEQGGTTLKDFAQADGNPGYFAQELLVYGKAGKPCPGCQVMLEEIRQAEVQYSAPFAKSKLTRYLTLPVRLAQQRSVQIGLHRLCAKPLLLQG